MSEESEAPWVEEFRPKTLTDVIGQTENVAMLRTFTTTSSIPHFLLTGYAGTGKTSSVIAFIRDFFRAHYGNDSMFDMNVLERNASDKSRIADLKELKDFLSGQTFFQAYPWKFVILDECEHISHDFQAALRRMMERAPPTTRFVLMCNESDDLIDPIVSRCSVMRFYPLTESEVRTCLTRILAQKEVQIPDPILHVIIDTTIGDLRNAINLLQLFALNTAEHLTVPDACRLCGILTPEEFQTLIGYLIDGHHRDAIRFFDVFPESTARPLLRQLVRWIRDQPLPPNALHQFLEVIAETDDRLTEGADYHLQFNALFCQTIDVLEAL
jgi:replication factor C small subunit